MNKFTRRNLMMSAVGLCLAGMPVAALADNVLNVGAYPANPPFEYKTASGSFEGFEVDVINEVAKRSNLTLNIADFGFQALFAATSTKRIDLAISSITITEERLKSQSFTQPYYDATTDFAARKDSPLKTFADLKGKTVGVISGTTGEKWVKKNMADVGIANVKGYNAKQEMLLDLISGRVDAAVNDTMRYGLAKNPDLEVKDSIASGDRLGMMMTKDHPLLGKVNDAISEMKKDGTMAKLYKKWFEMEPAAGSSTITVFPVPGS
jgi:polar amino acid transport system substrate-binding protein